jgi:integrase/recombinase XerD
VERDFAKEFLTYIQVEKGLARQTLESYKRDLERLQTWATARDKEITELTRADLRQWIASLSRDGLAPTSIARAVSTTRGFFKFLMLDGHIKSHPADDLDTPQRFNYLPKFLTEEEINRLLAAPDIATEEGIRDRAMLEIMYATGLRVSELVALKHDDVDLLAGLVVCHGKGNKQRRVPLGKSAIHWLQQYSAVKAGYGKPSTANIFLNRGRPCGCCAPCCSSTWPARLASSTGSTSI